MKDILKSILCGLFGPACLSGTLRAEVAIAVGNIQIPEGAVTHTFDIQISGGDAITDMVAYFEIEGGGLLFGGANGPKITSIDFSGSIWSAAVGGFAESATLAYPTQLQEISISLSQSAASVVASGKLCTITLDAAGFEGAFTFRMVSTKGGDTIFSNAQARLAATITNGLLLIGDAQPPTGPAVAPPVEIERLGNGDIRLGFPTQTGFTYTIEWDDDIVAPWTPLPDTAEPGNGGFRIWTDDGTLTPTHPSLFPRRFYRVRVE